MKAPPLLPIAMLALAASFLPVAGYGQAKSGKENLFTNALFAQGLDGWTTDIQKDTGNTVEVDKTELRNGQPTIKITNIKGGDTHLLQKVTVKPNTRYRMTAYVKTKDVVSVKRENGRPTGRGASLRVGNDYGSEIVDKSKPWAKLEVDFESGGATEMTMGPALGVYYDGATGTAWFSDLTLVELGRARK